MRTNRIGFSAARYHILSNGDVLHLSCSRNLNIKPTKI